MGSLQSINSIGIVFMPLLGTYILSRASHYPASDWRLGATFFLCAAMQALAVGVAIHYFRKRQIPIAPLPATGTTPPI